MVKQRGAELAPSCSKECTLSSRVRSTRSTARQEGGGLVPVVGTVKSIARGVSHIAQTSDASLAKVHAAQTHELIVQDAACARSEILCPSGALGPDGGICDFGKSVRLTGFKRI